jgi:hypothetical protein
MIVRLHTIDFGNTKKISYECTDIENQTIKLEHILLETDTMDDFYKKEINNSFIASDIIPIFNGDGFKKIINSFEENKIIIISFVVGVCEKKGGNLNIIFKKSQNLKTVFLHNFKDNDYVLAKLNLSLENNNYVLAESDLSLENNEFKDDNIMYSIIKDINNNINQLLNNYSTPYENDPNYPFILTNSKSNDPISYFFKGIKDTSPKETPPISTKNLIILSLIIFSIVLYFIVYKPMNSEIKEKISDFKKYKENKNKNVNNINPSNNVVDNNTNSLNKYK